MRSIYLAKQEWYKRQIREETI